MKKIVKQYAKAKVWDNCKKCGHLVMLHNVYTIKHKCIACWQKEDNMNQPLQEKELKHVTYNMNLT